MTTRHYELIANPPSDEQAGVAEMRLRRLLEHEQRQNRSELADLAPHVRWYFGAIHNQGAQAIRGLTERIEQAIATDRQTDRLPPLHRIALDALTADMVSRVTSVSAELVTAIDERGIDIGFIYPDPAERRTPVNAA